MTKILPYTNSIPASSECIFLCILSKFNSQVLTQTLNLHKSHLKGHVTCDSQPRGEAPAITNDTFSITATTCNNGGTNQSIKDSSIFSIYLPTYCEGQSNQVHNLDIQYVKPYKSLWVSPTITAKKNSLKFELKGTHLQSPNTIQIFLVHQILRERQPSKPLPTLKIWVTEDFRGLSLSLNNQWPKKISDICGLYGWDEHAALTQKTLKANNWENHLTVTIRVPLTDAKCPIYL